MLQMRNMNSVLKYKKMRARRPALDSAHGAAAAAWKTSTPSTRYCQENPQEKPQGGGLGVTGNINFITAAPAVTAALQCLVTATW